jgi:hypothetical protein
MAGYGIQATIAPSFDGERLPEGLIALIGRRKQE